MARTDFPSRTSMQEARLIAGDRRLFTRFRRVLRDNVYRRDFGEFLSRRPWPSATSAIASTAALALHRRAERRRSRRAACATCTRPCGWARPSSARARCASWPTRAHHAARAGGRRRRADLPVARAQRAALPRRPQERRAHARPPAADRQEPRLRGRRRDASGVERFMRDYYLHARVIHRVSRRLIARCQETLSRRGAAERRERQQALADGLVFFDGAPAPRPTATPASSADEPARIMKVFWHLHRLGCELVARTWSGAVEDSLDVVDERVPARSPAVRDLFLDICRRWGARGADALRDARAGRARGATCRSSARSPAWCSTTSTTSSPPTSTRCSPSQHLGGAGPRPVGGVGGRRPGLQRGGEARAA